MGEQSRSSEDPDIPGSWVPPDDRYPADFKPVVVHHPRLQNASRHAWIVFGQLGVAGFEEWARRLGGDPDKAYELLRLAAFAPQEMAKIFSDQTMHLLRQGDEKTALQVQGELWAHVKRSLSIPAVGKGRKPRNAPRDERIFDLHQQGKSFAQIAMKLGLYRGRKREPNRDLVQIAYRREAKRRKELYETYLQLKDSLMLLGIVFVESVPPTKGAKK